VGEEEGKKEITNIIQNQLSYNTSCNNKGNFNLIFNIMEAVLNKGKITNILS